MVSKGNPGSLEKSLILELRKGKYKMSVEYLVTSERKEVLRKGRGLLQGSQPEEAPMAHVVPSEQ